MILLYSKRGRLSNTYIQFLIEVSISGEMHNKEWCFYNMIQIRGENKTTPQPKGEGWSQSK